MKHFSRLLFLSGALLLAACSSSPETSIGNEIRNPLTASRYGDELADTMANLVITKDSIVDQPGMKDIIDKEIKRGTDLANAARRMQGEGMQGELISMKAEVAGHALLSGDTLYLSPDFTTKPGSDLHLYLTTVVDPRDQTFPDTTAKDLGVIQSAYGAQTYAVTGVKNGELFRTLVLWDKSLSRLYGFAQLSKSQ